MTRAKWALCLGSIAAVLAASGAVAQEANPFGELAAPPLQPSVQAPPPEVSPEPQAEKSVVVSHEPTIAEAVDAAADSTSELCQCVGEGNLSAVAKIQKALAGPLRSQGFDFVDTPLKEVVSLIQDEFAIPVQLDQTALDEIGISPEEPVNIKVSGTSLRSALYLMLKQLQVTYVIRNEVLIITTPESAEQELIVCVYDVRDLIQADSPRPQSKRASPSGRDNDFDSIIDIVASCVSTDTWAENGGGEAEIRPLRPGLIVISQTRAVHDEIRGLLAAIRSVRQQPPAISGAAEEHSAATDAMMPTSASSNEVVTRSYFLSIGQPAEPEGVRRQIFEFIVSSLPDVQFQGRLPDQQPVVITILPDRVLLRHTPEVQAKVEALLTDSGLAAAPVASDSDGGGRRGFGGRSGGGFDSGFGGGGFGGTAGRNGEGGGGFFRPRTAEKQ